MRTRWIISFRLVAAVRLPCVLNRPMIASLRGILLEKNLDTVVIEAGGVGYAVMVTAAAQRALPP